MATGYEDLVPAKASTGYEDLIPKAHATPSSQIPSPRKPQSFGEMSEAARNEFIQMNLARLQGLSSGAGNVMFGAQRLLGKGLTSVGATDTGSFLVEDALRRSAVEQAKVAPFKQEYPLTTGSAEFASEALATLPVGGGLAALAKPVAPRLAAALQSGGMAAGTPLALRATAGAATGGASTALISPEEAETGAVVGATLSSFAPPVLKKVAKGFGVLADMGKNAYARSGEFARKTLGTDVAQTINALRNAPPGMSVAEATAGIPNPAWQAFVKESLEKTPEGSAYLNRLATMTDQQAANELNQLAKGATETARRTARAQDKETLTDITSPARQAALTRANKGQRIAELETEAALLQNQASDEVAKVRDLVRRGEIAQAAARLELIKKNIPVGFARYTYPGELAVKADAWASKAAEGSLDLGQGAQFAKSAAESLRKSGLAPLKTDDIVGRISATLRDPAAGVAGNDVLARALQNVSDDMVAWTNSAGVIDARALESIRKNSVNATIRQLNPTMDATAQKRLAAGVLSRVTPMIDDAIEAAGGAGWKSYLADYAAGMRKINESKLVGEAARLWKEDKNGFVRLVTGESPDVVEKILGPKNYDIAKELADDVMSTLTNQANRHLARVAASEQATDGTRALAELIKQNSGGFQIVNPLNFYIAITNKTLAKLEDAIGKKSLQVLSQAMQSPQTAADLLATLPASERNRVLRLINSPELWASKAPAVAGAAVASPNNLAPSEAPVNALAR